MKQLSISVINSEVVADPLLIQIIGPPDQNGNSPITGQFALPTPEGATSQILGIQEGETVHIY